MSGFVPFRQTSGFMARLMQRPQGSEPKHDAGESIDAGPESGTSDDDPEGVALKEEILPQTMEELAALLEAAESETRAQVEASFADLQTKVEAERTALVCLMDNIDRARKEWAREVRSQLGEVLLVGVRQIVSESASLQSEALRQRITEVSERLIGEKHVILRVRTEDMEVARELVGERRGWQILPDDALVAGGCVAETDGGQIDATMGAAVSGLSSSVRDWIDGAEEHEEHEE